MRGIGDLLLMDCGIPAGKEFKMIVTGVIVVGIVLYAIWLSGRYEGTTGTVHAAAAAVPAAQGKDIAVNKLFGSRYFLRVPAPELHC